MKYKLKTVRVYELEFETDGYRILADGLWARGLRKEALQPFCWEKDVAPSRELQNWFGYNPKRFLIFRELYVKELDTNPYSCSCAGRIGMEKTCCCSDSGRESRVANSFAVMPITPFPGRAYRPFPFHAAKICQASRLPPV